MNVLAVCIEKIVQRSSRVEMAAKIKNMIGKMKMSILFLILHLGLFSFPRHYMYLPKSC
jgi:hypothetical protein